MVSISTRKLIKIGNKKYCSRGVTLPSDWIRFNQPENVDLYYDGLIILVPSGSKKMGNRVKKILEKTGSGE
jgi:hypothetical protein